jgi:hypothetical protein
LRHLKLVSLLITFAGMLAVAAGLALDLDKTVVLIGMMLIIAGGVKIAMVAVWRGFAGFGVPLASQDTNPPGNPPSREEGRS